jgi:hypothetical protein
MFQITIRRRLTQLYTPHHKPYNPEAHYFQVDTSPGHEFRVVRKTRELPRTIHVGHQRQTGATSEHNQHNPFPNKRNGREINCKWRCNRVVTNMSENYDNMLT